MQWGPKWTLWYLQAPNSLPTKSQHRLVCAELYLVGPQKEQVLGTKNLALEPQSIQVAKAQ